MPETDILNPVQGFDPDLGDSMCPSYGFTRKRATSRSNKKPVGGQPFSRELSNAGHVFELSWLGRTLACAQKLKKYAEQYEDGYFTIIDWESNGRHYVGHFTSDVTPVLTANNKWDVQMVDFTEIPICPMVEYNTDWENEAIWHYPFNDYGDQKLAASGAWTKTAHVFNGKGSNTMDNPGATAGDWAQYEYRGYGFRLYMMCGPEYGPCAVYLDSVQVGTVQCNAAAEMGPQKVFEDAHVSLDFHRVKIVILGGGAVIPTSGEGGMIWEGPTAASWYGMQVMR